MQQFAATILFQIEGADTPGHDTSLMFDKPVGDLPIVADARWSEGFTGHSLAALLVWVILLVVLQAATWPLVRRMFTALPDRGWAFARIVSLLLAAYPVWLLASIPVISFRAIWAGVSLIAVAAICWLVVPRFAGGDETRRPWKNPYIITAEILFWAVFGLFLLYRAINPDSYHPFWGGEKPMEFAHLNGILRSAHFPPVDPWYSGGYINYYYYGMYLVAFLVKLTGIPAEIAFNLAEPTFPALLAAGSFSIAAALGRRLTRALPGAILTGLLGAFFIQFAGNMIVAQRVANRALTGSRINDFTYWVFSPTRAIPDPDKLINITEFPYFAALYADLHPHVIAMPITVMVIALAWQVGNQAQMLPMIFIRRRIEAIAGFSLVGPLLLAALAIGTIYMTNAWDMPMYAAVTAVGIATATVSVPRLSRRLALIVATVLAVGLLAYLVALPFTLRYVALFSSLGTVTDRSPLLSIESHLGMQLLLVTLGMAGLAVMGSRRSVAFVVRYEVIGLGLLAVSLLIQWFGNNNDPTLEDIGASLVVIVTGAIWIVAAWLVTIGRADFSLHPVAIKTILIEVMAMVIVLTLLDRHTLALYLGIGVSAAMMWFALRGAASRFVAMLIAAGTLLGAALELVYLVDDLTGTSWYRMNTIFKFYNQIWNLLGIATAVLAGYAFFRVVVVGTTENQDGSRQRERPSIWTWACAGLSIPLMVASLAYAVVATPIRLDQGWGVQRDGLTLNAYDWMEHAQMPLSPSGAVTYADDLVAIDWLNENIEGTPVIAEASFGPYRCNGSRFSIATGLPAPVGWVRHEMQQRYPDALGRREADLRTLYTTGSVDEKMAIINRYGIEYIIVGQTERHYPTIDGNECIDTGSAEGIAAIERMEGKELEIAFQHGTTTIYRVVRG